MSEQRVSRRNFIQTTTMTAVGAALGMNTLAAVANCGRLGATTRTWNTASLVERA